MKSPRRKRFNRYLVSVVLMAMVGAVIVSIRPDWIFTRSSGDRTSVLAPVPSVLSVQGPVVAVPRTPVRNKRVPSRPRPEDRSRMSRIAGKRFDPVNGLGIVHQQLALRSAVDGPVGLIEPGIIQQSGDGHQMTPDRWERFASFLRRLDRDGETMEEVKLHYERGIPFWRSLTASELYARVVKHHQVKRKR